MPTISVFYGIVIRMFFDDREPPRALRLVRTWISLHEEELAENWRLAKARLPVARVEPLP